MEHAALDDGEKGQPAVFLSYSRASWRDQAEALTTALRRRGAQVSPSPEPQADELRPLIASRIAEADLMVVLVAAGDERSGWMQDDVREMLQTCWRRPEARIAVVAPAVGAIPTGLRHKEFVRYFAHEEAHTEGWTEASIVERFVDQLLQTSPDEAEGEQRLPNADLRMWRNRLLHLGSQITPDSREREALVRTLRTDLEDLRPVVERAKKEGASFTLDDARAVLDRALIAQALHDADLLVGYYQLASAVRRITQPDRSETGNSVDYGLGLVASEVKDLPAARELFSLALDENERLLGPDHPATIAAGYKLATIFAALGELESAKAAYERVLGVATDALGDDHPQTAGIAYNLGVLHAQLGDRQRARVLLEHAENAYRRVRPDDSPELEATLQQLAALG